ncbi:MAG: sugar ABC transporter substrate-binding protein [Candidatus Hydrogenedentes bacterium]|nr:sugar ABC transporter substrate-binding protein [Candidatus Hydrogenedentota bacterium]
MQGGESRRAFCQWSSSSFALGGRASLLGCSAAPPAVAPAEGGKRYKAAFSNAGLQSTWCTHGIETVKRWGNWLGVDITVYDSQFNIDKQRQDIEDMATKEWDFVAMQAYAIKTLEEPVKRLIEKGIPVIDFDTRIVPEGEDIGLWTFMSPDHEGLAEQATEMMIQSIGGKGKIVTRKAPLRTPARNFARRDFTRSSASIRKLK